MRRRSFGELGGRDPYDILELPSGAPDDDVRAARKRLLRRYHPDLPSGDLRRTQLITAAADLLLDPLRRTGYYHDLRDDEAGRSAFATAGSADEEHRATRPDRSDGAGTSPAQRIRPTFVTPSGSRGQEPPSGSHGQEPPSGSHGQEPPSGSRGHDSPSGSRGQDSPSGDADRRHGGSTGRPAVEPRWNTLAVASVVAILTWTPIPLVLGLFALGQIRRSGQRGRRLALTGVIVGAIFVLIYVYVLVLPSLT